MEHLVRVEVLCEPPMAIVSVTGYREVEQAQFDKQGRPMFDPAGAPLMKVTKVAETADVEKGGFALLDPAETNIAALTQAGLVRIAPKAKK